MTTIDVTDATFQTDVLDRSATHPVIVDLWAPWCGPCKTLSPILEKVVDETNGKAVLAKVNVDENPQLAQAFRAQSIPAVHAVKDGAVVASFIGAQPEAEVRRFVESVVPSDADDAVAELVRAGDEFSLRRALEIVPDHQQAITQLAALLIDDGRSDEALELLGRIPETPETRRLAALVRTGGAPDDIETKLEALLPRVRDDDSARQEFVDLLDVMGHDDPRTAQYRKRLTSALF